MKRISVALMLNAPSPSVNRTEQELRFLVPSALRVSAAGYV